MILITGAGGFIGRAFATHLHGNGEVVLASGRREHDEFFSEKGIPYVKLDISNRDDYENIDNNNIKKSYTLRHLCLQKKVHSAAEYISINGNGILHLLDFCVQNNVTKFVNISSVSVYGMSGKNGVKEDVYSQPLKRGLTLKCLI